MRNEREMEEGDFQKAKHTKLNNSEIAVSRPVEILNPKARGGRDIGNSALRQETPDHSIQNRSLQDHGAVKINPRPSSNNAAESSSEPNSLNDSSSVEVLSELDDEAKFENSLSSFNQFEH